MGEPDIQKSILKALGRMSLVQQLNLLEFINSMLAISWGDRSKGILQFAGLFDPADSREFESSLKDVSQIDGDEW
ncbi:MAG: hypothetical protein SF052_21575 [Bacteroidia bacterium]|nr:hypothetical protein [Bacteroidia bacterium]